MLTLRVAILLAGAALAPVQADESAVAGEIAPCSASGEFGQGVAAHEAQDWGMAERLLARAFAADPGCWTPEYGSVALWLGRVHFERRRFDEAALVWQAGMAAIAETDDRDLHLTDRFVVSVALAGIDDDGPLLAALFNRLVASACEPAWPWEKRALARRVAQAAALIDAPWASGLENRLRLERATVLENEDDCRMMVRWFDEQDPLPATAFNERLIEHIERSAWAEVRYASNSDVRGYDDRGEIHVRYGEPLRNYSLRYDDLRFAREVFRFGVDISRSDFAEHEIWTYGIGSSEYTFIFVEDRSGYRLGTSLDLLPQRFRYGFNHSARGQNYATAALGAMRWIFERLALNHPGYATIYGDLSAYDDRQDALRIVSQNNPQRQTSDEALYNLDYQLSIHAHSDRPSHFVQGLIAKTGAQERELASHRERRMPTATSAIPAVDRLAVDQIRYARLLESDGSTRVIVFWRDQMSGPDDAELDAAFGLRHRARLLSASGATGRSLIADTTYSVTATETPVVRVEMPLTAAFPGAELQVDRHLGSGAWLGSGTSSLPPISPLSAEQGLVEVSDLLPFHVDNLIVAQARMREEPGLDELPLLADRGLSTQDALGAYFEIYVPGSRGRDTDIVIAYEVVRKSRGGLLRRAREESMLLPFRRVNAGERLPAAFFVDRSAWEGADEIELVVTVTDVASGRDIVRTLGFSIDGS